MKNLFKLLVVVILTGFSASAAGVDHKSDTPGGVEVVAAPVSVYSTKDIQEMLQIIAQDNLITESGLNEEATSSLQQVRYEIQQGNQIIEADLSNAYQPLDFKRINSAKSYLKVKLPAKPVVKQ